MVSMDESVLCSEVRVFGSTVNIENYIYL